MIAQCNLKRLSTRGYSFQASLLCELLWNGARIKEIPIVFGERPHGKSKLALRDQCEFVVNLFCLRLRRPRQALANSPITATTESGAPSFPRATNRADSMPPKSKAMSGFTSGGVPSE